MSIQVEARGRQGKARQGPSVALQQRQPQQQQPQQQVGVHLAWTELRVAVSWGSGAAQKTLLDGLTGYADPGTITAIMGPSGSGKSTLLDALAGRLSKNCVQTGDILANGRKQKLSHGVAAYVTQDDTLLGTLTVYETVLYTAFFRLPDRMPRKQKLDLVASIIKDMGLEDASHTPIGNWHLKGLSGGEKRRVTIALELLTSPRLLFLDEPTSGLDSAAAFFVTTTLKHLARDGRTVITSIHQPSSEVFQLFDNLFLVSGGKTVYFGAAASAHQHFVDSGMPCPPWRNPADHFLRAINSDFDRVKAALGSSARHKLKEDDDIELADSLSAIPTSERVDILINRYTASDFAITAHNKAMEISQMGGAVLQSTGSAASTLMQVVTLTRRSSVNMFRDIGYYWLRLAMYAGLALAIGTIFFRVGTGYNAIQARAAAMVFTTAFLTFMAIGAFPSFTEEMKVFTRERLNGHYGVAAFVISNSLSSLPFLALTALVSGAIMYYLVNLHPGFDHFIYFVLMIFASTAAVEGLMMVIASVVPNFLMGIVIGAGIQGGFMLTGGYFRLPNDLPKPVWRYPMSYIAFHTYGFQGLFENDFPGLSFESSDYAQTGQRISGEDVLRNTFQVSGSRGKWLNLGILFVQIALYRLLFFVVIKLTERLGPHVRSRIARWRTSREVPKPTALHPARVPPTP